MLKWTPTKNVLSNLFVSKIVKLPFWETSKDEMIKGKKKYSSTYFKEKK